MGHRKNCNSFSKKKCKINNQKCEGLPCVDYTSREEAQRIVAELKRLEHLGFKLMKEAQS